MPLDLPAIRAAVRAARLTWRYHALRRAAERQITRQDALEVIERGTIIEERPRARPYPKALMMTPLAPDRPLYVSLAYDAAAEWVYIITVHWLDPRKWEDPWTRKGKKKRSKKEKLL